MFHIDTGKDIEWIEIFLRERCKTNLNEYLTKYYDIPSDYVSVENKVYCCHCDAHFTWLQGHLTKKHSIRLDDYLKQFQLKPEFEQLVSDKIETVQRKTNELNQVKIKARKNFVAGKSEQLVLQYQKTRDDKIFKVLLREWRSKISVHAKRNANCMQSLSPIEACFDMYQELLESFVAAVNTYDIEKKIKFKTYVWTCLQGKTQIIRNSFLTQKRKTVEQSIHDLTYSSGDSSEDIESRIYANSAWGDYSTELETGDLEFQSLIRSVDPNEVQKEIIAGIIAEKTKTEVCRKANITRKEYLEQFENLKEKFNTVRSVHRLFITLREVEARGIR